MKVEYMKFFMELGRREEKGREEGSGERRGGGTAEGRAEGRAEGLAEGAIKGKAEALMGLVHDGLLTMKEAAKRAGMTEEAFRKLAMH